MDLFTNIQKEISITHGRITKDIYKKIIDNNLIEYFLPLNPNHMQIEQSQQIYYHATDEGNIAILRLLLRNNYMHFNPFMLYRLAASHGDLIMLEYFLSNQFPIQKKDTAIPINAAAKKGYLGTIEWLLERGFQFDLKTMMYAGLSGNFELIKWLREKGCPWDGSTSFTVAFSGRLDILIWLIENGCPYGNHTLFNAVASGNIKMVKYLKKLGIKWHNGWDFQFLSISPDMMEYLHNVGAPGQWNCKRNENCIHCLHNIWTIWDQEDSYLNWPPQEVLKDVIGCFVFKNKQ